MDGKLPNTIVPSHQSEHQSQCLQSSEKCTLVTGWRVGSVATPGYNNIPDLIMAKSWITTMKTSEGMIDSEWDNTDTLIRRSGNDHPKQRHTALQKSPLCSKKSCWSRSKVVNQLEAPFKQPNPLVWCT